VLVVDDDDDIRDVMRQVLEAEGYVVEQAENGARALEALERVGSDCVVLLDLMMPVMTGWEVVEELKRSGRSSVRVIIVSATPDDAPAPYPVVQKPLPLRQLLKMLEEAARR
jgi:CheY-like chemotaxis protein